MATPAIQTLLTDAQQVLNLNSLSEVRSTMAAALANANVGTPLNPNLTTQQLWDEFYLIVRQPESDIESIITNQLMKFLFAPPAPGGAGANGQVIFNDGGVLAGDPQFLWNKTTNLLTVTGSATITGDLTVDTSTLKVDSANNRVGIGTASPSYDLQVNGSTNGRIQVEGASGFGMVFIQASSGNTAQIQLNSNGGSGRRYLVGSNSSGQFLISDETGSAIRLAIDSTGVFTFQNVGGVAGTAMTLNATGLGVGVSPSAWNSAVPAIQVKGVSGIYGAGSSEFGMTQNNFYNASGQWIYGTTAAAGRYSISAGVHAWYTVGSGTAGTQITWTQAMTLDASGNLLVGQTSSALQSGGTGITLYGSTASEIKFLNSTTGSSATDGTALVTTGNNFSINNRESGFVSIGTSNAERVSVKTNGQVRFVPLAADPASAEAGDVYYNSVSNKLKCYNGATWNDLF